MAFDEAKDLQSIWHGFVGKWFVHKKIIDVGAGRGHSKRRLSWGNNEVITTDTNRAFMTAVDWIVYTEHIKSNGWDVATAFDVIEHSVDPMDFVRHLKRIGKSIFVTAPNWNFSPAPWRYKPERFRELMLELKCKRYCYFVRQKGWNYNNVRRVSKHVFLNHPSYGIGIFATNEEPTNIDPWGLK